MRASIGCWALAALAFCGPAQAGEEGTIKTFAAWRGLGVTMQTGAQQATFVGALVGQMYVDTEKGPVASGSLACPAVLDIGTEDASQRGKARCTITAKDGGKIYAEIDCQGVYLVGCNGDFKLTGGTERFAGISGGGKVIIRSDTREITAKRDVAAEEGTGILYIRELSYKIP